MNMEEIVTLSVKHNVSDLHLCNAWPARWRKRGRIENAPFIAPDVDMLLRDWLNDAQQYQWRTHGQLDFAVSLSGAQRLRASAFRHQQGASVGATVIARSLSFAGGDPDAPHRADTACQREWAEYWLPARLAAVNLPRWRRWWVILITMSISIS
ncbi:type II secretion system ATP-binding protein [Salmonella bongori]|nr:type II secretion system ATP-binding protein [Salmonella bongori]